MCEGGVIVCEWLWYLMLELYLDMCVELFVIVCWFDLFVLCWVC